MRQAAARHRAETQTHSDMRLTIVLSLPLTFLASTGQAQLTREWTERPRWLEEPADGVRGAAQLGALAGIVAGAAIGIRHPCGGAAPPPCELETAVIGSAIGSFTGSTLGGAFGAIMFAGCRAPGSLIRASAGATLWSTPAALYFALVPPARGSGELGFALAVTLPLMQAEGSARAASACRARADRASSSGWVTAPNARQSASLVEPAGGWRFDNLPLNTSVRLSPSPALAIPCRRV